MSDFDYNSSFKIITLNDVIEKSKKKTIDPQYIAKASLTDGRGWSSITNKFLIDKKNFINNNLHLKKYFDDPTLAIPKGTTFNVPGHKCEKGDTATSIAAKYGMTVKEFLELNKISTKTAAIKAGQVYYVYAQPSKAYKDAQAKRTDKPYEPAPSPSSAPPAAKKATQKPTPAKVETKQTPSTSTPAATKINKTEKLKEKVCKNTGISRSFINRLIQFEGVERVLKSDPIERPVIGIGHDLACRPASELKKYKRLKAQGHKLSDEEIYKLLESDILEAQKGLKKIFGENYDKLNQGQKEALIDLTFNIGSGGLEKSKKLINHINNACEEINNNPKKAAAHFLRSAQEFDHRCGGDKVLPGLCKRRVNDILKFTNLSPGAMPKKVLEKLYENYAKGLYASKSKIEYFRTTNELLGCILVKNKKGKIEILSLNQPVTFKTNNRKTMTDVVLASK